MADALLSPAVGAGFIAASALGIGLSARKLAKEQDDAKAPLMGVLGAFVFAAQMINFTIPATGSSGHLGGGMLLALLLGPYAALIVIASVLIIQALLFADGGILALGTNIWNLGVYPCFIGFGVFKILAGKSANTARISISAVVATIVSLELGAFSVALQTTLSGRSDLPFRDFSILILGIHFPIALVEGLVTIAIVNFIYKIRPALVKESLGLSGKEGDAGLSYKPVAAFFLVAALIAGGLLARYASKNPDGLEWSISKITGVKNEKTPASNGSSGIVGSLIVMGAAAGCGAILLKIRKKDSVAK